MRVEAGRCARIYELVEGRPRTVAVEIGGRRVPLDGPEVSVTVGDRRWTDAELIASPVEAGAGAGRLAWTLTSPAGDLTVRMVVEADADAGVVRKRAEIIGRGRLAHVELDRWAGSGIEGPAATGEPVAYNAGPIGLGQPLFGPGFFAGVEHPMAENLARPDGASCALPVAVDLGPEPYRTPATVLGAGGLEEFWDYIDTLRPVPPRLVTLSNNWYHLGAPMTMDEGEVRAEVDGFAGVAARHGLALDFLALDDGWEGEWDVASGLWGRMAPSRFPAGLAPLGDRVGLWLSAFGGYGARRDARLAEAHAQGFEVDRRANLLCAAGRRYRAHLLDVLTRWTEAGVGYWKLDGVSFTCAETDHGHVTGAGARTHLADLFADLVGAVRAVRPDSVVAFTIGSHPSAWWLGVVDFVWRGGLDDAAEGHRGSRLDRFDTSIDTCLQAYRPAAFPVSGLVTFSVVETAAASYRSDDVEAWARHCWLAAGRGTLHQDLYVAPDSLTEAEWGVLAAALAWERLEAPLLAHSRMVLGDPGAGEVYGFVSRRRDRAVACLRNPSDRPQPVGARWDDLLGFPPAAVRTRYGPPADATTLGPFEVLLVEARAL
ncbi:MAG: hypothetical protein ACR2HM_02225 [Acidimicrobiales bacterium]